MSHDRAEALADYVAQLRRELDAKDAENQRLRAALDQAEQQRDQLRASIEAEIEQQNAYAISTEPCAPNCPPPIAHRQAAAVLRAILMLADVKAGLATGATPHERAR